jgi:hypothetical protein
LAGIPDFPESLALYRGAELSLQRRTITRSIVIFHLSNVRAHLNRGFTGSRPTGIPGGMAVSTNENALGEPAAP